MKKIVHTVEETQAIATQLAQLVAAGDTIILNGDLGAGKTTFTQGFARALGIKRPLKSPTFTLVREYQTPRYPLYHLDVYRLGEEGGSDEIGLEEYLGGDGVALVEWPEFIMNLLPNAVITVNLSRILGDDSGQQRQIELTGSTPRLQKLVNQIG
ncbi:hypothetical protein IV73_GL001107 [Weissella kandleri]|uniref:tRNA threonylcarbamoyladenosine biosynthesis protein TsaE n=1 Tax=Weissella kandleri TaxID=1616 RepID=A0A0R2JC13_9LACO|nr:tRNA (adenosine(37)-N6)-threonylcarbamoyltransferase complex ATPase subunit type 1 TsaE [Weissella kandleri]KRN74830.1 hypothetical protein IV73_GL001107 [Weissella kandleri]